MNEHRGAPDRSHRQKVLSPFPFLRDSEKHIVNIVHNAILASLRAVVKNQVIFEALDEERRNVYWSWKMKTARQVPEEVLQLLSTHDRESVLYYMQQHRLDKAFSACSYGPAEAQRLFQKWADKVKVSENEEWMEVVFDSAQKTLNKWTEASNFNDKTSSKSSMNPEKSKQETTESSGSKTPSNSHFVMESEKSERGAEDSTARKAPLTEDRASHTKEAEQRTKTPRADDIDDYHTHASKVVPPVPPTRKKNISQNNTNGEETGPVQNKGSDVDSQNSSAKKRSEDKCNKCECKKDTSRHSVSPPLNKQEYDSKASHSGALVTSKPPPSFVPDHAYGNQMQLSNPSQQFAAPFGNSNPVPGATYEITTTYKVTVPGVPHHSSQPQVVAPTNPATVQEIDNENTDCEKQRDVVEKKSLPQDVSTQPSSSTPKPTEFKKFHNIKALNILLLGETGVGKTTFVNSLANYLRYNTLAEALAGDPVVLVDASFVQGFENGESTNVHVTSNSGEHKEKIKENEHLNDAGASCTQSTVEHVFEWMDGEEPKLVRIIDTPGINDTRGAQKDKENLNNIMKHVTEVGELHAICILMKPNEAKLNHSFRSCIDHLLMSLHRSATTNILFCFTMTRSNMYRPGDSLATLRAYLDKLERDTGVLIKADSSNLFSFENDCFRYMCAVRQIPELNNEFNMKTFSEGWRHNVPECIKMFKRVEGLVPHSVEDTVSINNTRHTIEKIVRPLADLAKNHIVNMKLLQEYIEAAANPDKNGDYLASQVYQEQITIVPKRLAFPRTVCNAPCCVEYIQVNKYQTKTVHKRICHDRCGTTSVMERGRSDRDLKYCVAFEKRNGWCEVCNCHWKQHSFEIYDLQYETTLVEDVTAKMKVDDYVNRQKTREVKLSEQKEKLHQMQQESDQIRDCCVEMAAFLEKNSVIKGCDPFYENLRQLVEEEENKVVLGLDCFDMAVELVNLQVSYKNRVDYVISEINSSRRSVLTTEQLNSMIDSLALMKYAGPTFACLRDYQLSADATAHQAENLAPPPDLIRENRGNAQPSNSYGFPRNGLYPDLH